MIVPVDRPFYGDANASVWTLKPLEKGYTLYMQYENGTKPTLIAYSSKFFWEKIAVTGHTTKIDNDLNYFNIYRVGS